MLSVSVFLCIVKLFEKIIDIIKFVEMSLYLIICKFYVWRTIILYTLDFINNVFKSNNEKKIECWKSDPNGLIL